MSEIYWVKCALVVHRNPARRPPTAKIMQVTTHDVSEEEDGIMDILVMFSSCLGTAIVYCMLTVTCSSQLVFVVLVMLQALFLGICPVSYTLKVHGKKPPPAPIQETGASHRSAEAADEHGICLVDR
jgi:hypothetical protein